jgi:hypothetical protein
MNVSHQSQKVFIPVAEEGLISSLKEMPHFMVLPIKVTSVSKIYELHYFGKGHILRFHKEVRVIRHEHICIEDKVAFFIVVFDAAKKFNSILIAKKYVLPLITANDHVVKSPLKFYARRSCHEKYYFKYMKSSLTPGMPPQDIHNAPFLWISVRSAFRNREFREGNYLASFLLISCTAFLFSSFMNSGFLMRAAKSPVCTAFMISGS